MTVGDPEKSPVKPPHLDHPPTVPGTRRQAIWFSVIIVLGILSPLIWGFKIGQIVPVDPTLTWILAVDSRTMVAADAIHERKVVFIGGSNIRFGVNAPTLSRSLGMPVINFGVHAGLGIDIIVDRALQCVKSGDIVVFAPELSHFRKRDTADFSPELRVDFLALRPSPVDRRLQSFPVQQWELARDRCDQIRTTIERTIRVEAATFTAKIRRGPPFTPPPSPYVSAALDPSGNIIFPRPAPTAYNTWALSGPPKNVAATDMINSVGGAAFAELSVACKERGCTLCVMPPFRLNVPQYDQPELIRIEQHWLDFAVKNGAIEIMKPGETLLPREDGYDTDYHLNDIGVRIMEPRLVAALKPILLAR